MFGIDSSELAIIALVALLVIGPKDLPRVMRQVGQWLAKGRAMSRHVRSGFDAMMREAELEEMQAQWAAQNEAIMKATALPDLGISGAAHAYDSEDWTSDGPAVAALEAPAEAPAITEKPKRSRAKPAADAGVSAEATPTGAEAAPAAKAPRKRSPRAKASPPATS